MYCLTCYGLIPEPFKAHGFAGKYCFCEDKQKKQYQPPVETLVQCGCIGPQNGQPLCPCQMLGLSIKDGRYQRVQDFGPVA